MKILKYFVFAILFALTSCTLDKTDYEAELYSGATEHTEFKEAASFTTGNYKIGVKALNGEFYKGYNEIQLKITEISSNVPVNVDSVTFLPILNHSDGNKTSGPHRYSLAQKDNYFSGYSVFTNETGNGGSWQIFVSFKANNQTFSANKEIAVKPQSNMNLNMTAFTGNDGEQYYIALVAPQKPKVAENALVAGIYKYNKPASPGGTFPDPSQFSFSEVNGYALKLDPRMPEPSMGNHSSPNNKDLTQQSDGLYHGVVNYTMTGNWTLNFILEDANKKIIKGTVVPKDFTPGVQGVKSELFIDTLF